MQQWNFLLSCVISLWTKDNLCVHCTPAYSLLTHPDCNCEGKLRLLITATAQGLIIIGNVVRVNVHNWSELLWEGLAIFTRGILKGFYYLWQMKLKEIIFSLVIIACTPHAITLELNGQRWPQHDQNNSHYHGVSSLLVPASCPSNENIMRG